MNKLGKRLLGAVLAAMLVCGGLVAGVVPASAATKGAYTYTVSNGEAMITRVNTSIRGAIKIPSTLGEYPVTSIGDRAFSYCDSLTNITIPNSVNYIGDYAFGEATKLTARVVKNSYAHTYCVKNNIPFDFYDDGGNPNTPSVPADDGIGFISLWGKQTNYVSDFWNWVLCIVCFGWIWMAF